MATLMHPPCNMSKEERSTKTNQKLYRGMIGSLLYLTTSKPDILYNFYLSARFQSDPRETRLTVVKRIFRYLKGTKNMGLLYKKSLDNKLVKFCDADYTRDIIERNYTIGKGQFIGENLISCASKRQATTILLTAEEKYILFDSRYTQLPWMKYQLEVFIIYGRSIPFLCDNTTTIRLTKNHIQHSRT